MAFTLRLSAETRRKFKIFRQNRRGFTSFVILTVLLVLSVFAELYANSRPLVIFYQGAFYFPLWQVYADTTFGGDFVTEADYQDPFIRDHISSGGNWAIYPPIHWDYQTLNRDPALYHPSPFPPRALFTDHSLRHVRAQHPPAPGLTEHLRLDGPECLCAGRIPARPQL